MITKKRIVGISCVVILMIIGIGVLSWQLSFRNVSFVLSDEVESVKIYKHAETHDYTGDARELAAIDKNKTIRLQDGEYEVAPSGKNVDTSRIIISVDNDTKEIKVEPGFTDKYLNDLLGKEKASAQQVIKDKYNKIIDSYIISDGQLLLDGSWYITTLSPPQTAQELMVDSHRVILQRVDNRWKIVAEPSLVFKYDDYPNIPKVVVNKANMYSIN